MLCPIKVIQLNLPCKLLVIAFKTYSVSVLKVSVKQKQCLSMSIKFEKFYYNLWREICCWDPPKIKMMKIKFVRKKTQG